VGDDEKRRLIVMREPAYTKGVACPKFVPTSISNRRCVHYWDGGSKEFPGDNEPDLEGACDRDDEFMCVRWMGAYPYAYEDVKGRMHRVDPDGVIHMTPGTQSKLVEEK
jgi:hypothetical protein